MSENTTINESTEPPVVSTTLARTEELIGDDVYVLILASNPSGAQLAEAFKGINPALAKKALKSLEVTPEVVDLFKQEWARADSLGLEGQRVEHALRILFDWIQRGLV